MFPQFCDLLLRLSHILKVYLIRSKFYFLQDFVFREKTYNCENLERKRLNKGTIFFFEIRNYTVEWRHQKNKERTEAVAWRGSMKKMILEILQN